MLGSAESGVSTKLTVVFHLDFLHSYTRVRVENMIKGRQKRALDNLYLWMSHSAQYLEMYCSC